MLLALAYQHYRLLVAVASVNTKLLHYITHVRPSQSPSPMTCCCMKPWSCLFPDVQELG